MRRQILLSVLSLVGLCSWGQASDATVVTVNLAEQRLSEAVPNTESVTSLTLTSTKENAMKFEDAKYLHENFANLETLDMSGMYFGSDTSSSLDVTVPTDGTNTRTLQLKCENRVVPNALCYGKTKLRKVMLPNQSGWNVTQVGHSSFSGCTSLEEIDFGGNANFSQIAAYAFRNCSSLKSIDLSKFVNNTKWQIGQSAFVACTSLETIIFPADKSKGPGVIGGNAFNGCKALASVEFPNSVYDIGIASFSVCENLASVTLPENEKFTTISNFAFSRCGKLTTISIPASVTKVGKGAFNSSGLTSLTVTAATPPECDLSDATNHPFASIRNNRFRLMFSGNAEGHEAEYRNAGGWDYLMSKALSENDDNLANQMYYRNEQYPNAVYEGWGLADGNGLRMYLQREFTEGWNSLVLPFSASGDVVKAALGEDVKVARLTGFDGEKLTFTYVPDCSLEEDVPVIVSGIAIPTEQREMLSAGKMTPKDNVYVFEGVSVSKYHQVKAAVSPVIVGGIKMDGSFAKKNLTLSNGYFLQNGTLYAASASNSYKTKGFRAWFELTGSTAKGLTFSVEDGSVTGIDAVGNAQVGNDVVYDMQGRVVENPVRGIYVRNGKKFVVR